MDKRAHTKDVTNSASLKSNTEAVPQRQKGPASEMEKLLTAWIHDRLRKNTEINMDSIKSKARRIFEKQKVKFGATEGKFVASNSWFKRFSVRSNIPDLFGIHLIDADHIKEIISEDGYTAQQVYSVSEMVLPWKSIPGRKQLYDNVTVMMGCNAEGDHKLKPLFLNLGTNDEEKAIVFFEKWFYKHFIIDVKNYCEENSISLKILLIINDNPWNSICVNHPKVKILFLPQTIFVIQPMNQGVIPTVTASYILVMLAELAEGQYRDQAINDFLISYNLKQAENIVSEAWNMITNDCLKASWKKLCPYFVNEECSENCENLTQDIMKYAEILQMPINFNDVTNFLNDQEVTQSSETAHNDRVRQSSETANIQQSDDHSVVSGGFDVKEMALAFHEISSAFGRFKKMDPDYLHFLKVWKGVETKIKCYKTIYESMKTSENLTTLDLELDKNLPSTSSYSMDRSIDHL